MKWLRTLQANLWWQRSGAQLMLAVLSSEERERVEAALRESELAREALAHWLRCLDGHVRRDFLIQFAVALPDTPSPERALLRTINWVTAKAA
jgi:hypothetical protein